MNCICSKNPRVLKIVLCSILFVLLCLGACAALVIRCERLNSPPEAPVYPHSTLVNQVSSGLGTSKWPMVTFDYISTDSPDKIVAFYQGEGSCRENEGYERMTCRGKARPFGEYFVYIDLASYTTKGTTSYVLELRWRGCTWEWE